MRSHTERRSEVFNHRHQFHMRIGAWRARDLPETALHVISPCLTTQPLAGAPTCAVVWGREVLHGVVGPPPGRKLVTTMAKGLMTNDGLTEPFSDSRRCTSGCLEPATTGRTGACRQEGKVVQQPQQEQPEPWPEQRGRCGSWPPSRRALHPPRHPVGTLSGALVRPVHSRRWFCRPSRPVGCRPSPPLLLACAKKMRLAAFNPTRGLCRVLRVRWPPRGRSRWRS
jgi:hypothetical protein